MQQVLSGEADRVMHGVLLDELSSRAQRAGLNAAEAEADTGGVGVELQIERGGAERAGHHLLGLVVGLATRPLPHILTPRVGPELHARSDQLATGEDEQHPAERRWGRARVRLRLRDGVR